MSGIYIHIPFCKQKCHYCDFHFSVSMKNKDEILKCLLHEFELRNNFFGADNTQIDTIYFGGGTPSILNGYEINILIDEMSKYYNLDNVQEITLECNPDDLTKEKLSSYSRTPINRLSIGIQSFNDDDLVGLNRAHNSLEAKRCVEWAQEAGFSNITIDLIYGLPNSNQDQWQYNLDMAEKLNIPHLSCYALTIEKRTALHHFIQKGIVQPAKEEDTIQQFDQLMEWAKQQGMTHYEISNFAKNGYFAVHNTNYWKNKSYIGFGPSAHSYNGKIRSWNIANNAKYIRSLNNGILPLEEELLTIKDQFNEYILTGLRTMWGIERDRLASFGEEALIIVNSNIEAYVESGHIIDNGKRWTLSRNGKYIADRISSDLFWV